MQIEKSVKSAIPSVIMLSLALAIRQMSMTMVMPFISTYSKSLIGYTPLLAGIAIGIFGLMQAIFQIPFGMLSDRYGNKKLMLIGLALVVIGLFMACFVKSVGMLIFARALQGCGAIIGVGYSWAAGMAGKKEIYRAMSILGTFISAAAAFALAAGPLLREIMTVNIIFLSCAILLFVNGLYILFFIKDKNVHEEQKSPDDKHIKILLKDKNFVAMNLSAFINNYLAVSVFYAVPIILAKVTGGTGMWKIFGPAVLIAILIMKIAVRWSQKGFNNQVLMIAFIVSACSLFLYFEKSSYLFLLLGTTLFMCGYISIAAIVATNVNNAVEDSYRGTANGIFNSFQYVGNFAGAVATGALWGISEGLTWFITIGIGLVGFFIIMFNRVPHKSIIRESNGQ